MPEPVQFHGRYLAYPPPEHLVRRLVWSTHQLSSSLSVTIHDSDPMHLAVFHKDGKPVLVENCVVNVEQWLWRTSQDTEFLRYVESL